MITVRGNDAARSASAHHDCLHHTGPSRGFHRVLFVRALDDGVGRDGSNLILIAAASIFFSCFFESFISLRPPGKGYGGVNGVCVRWWCCFGLRKEAHFIT